MARRSSTSPLRRFGLIAVAAALAGAVGAAGARLARRRGQTAAGVAVQDSYRCRCGAKYRVSGMDRHRVYWPKDAPESEPVLGDRCPNCDAPLPAGHETATA